MAHVISSWDTKSSPLCDLPKASSIEYLKFDGIIGCRFAQCVKGIEFSLVELGSVFAFDLHGRGESVILNGKGGEGQMDSFDHFKSAIDTSEST